MATREVWRPIPGYEGYEASDQGRVRSVDREVWCGTHFRKWKGRILKPAPRQRTDHGCVTVGGRQWLIHNLVMLAFVGPMPEGMQTCHNNDNALDNRLVNLRYDTPKGNSADMVRSGNSQRGTKQWAAKLTEKDVHAIRASTEGSYTLARRYGVRPQHIWKIRTRRAWGWLC